MHEPSRPRSGTAILATLLLRVRCICAGSLADRFDAGPVFAVSTLLLLACSWPFCPSLPTRPELLFPLSALACLCVGVIGAVPYVMVKAFPAAVRFSGLSFSYNVAYAILGGLTPMAVTGLLKVSPMAPAYYVAVLCGVGLAVGVYLLVNKR